jgi:hypothetical protein
MKMTAMPSAMPAGQGFGHLLGLAADVEAHAGRQLDRP